MPRFVSVKIMCMACVSFSHTHAHTQRNPLWDLDLSSHACRAVNVSFAVVSSHGPSQFSDEVTLDVFGGVYMNSVTQWLVAYATRPLLYHDTVWILIE